MKDASTEIRRISPRRVSPNGGHEAAGSDPDRLDPADAEGVLEFGLAAQRQVSVFYDRLLAHARAKDTEYVRGLLRELMQQLRRVNPARIREGTLLGRIPVLGKRLGSPGRFFADYEKASAQVERVGERLEEARTQLLRDVELFEKLHDQNGEHLRGITRHLRVVEEALDGLRAAPPEPVEDAASLRDPVEVHRVEDHEQRTRRLDRRKQQLTLAREVSLQAAGQIRLFQNGLQILVEDIQAALLNAVPLWRNQIAVAIARTRHRQTLRLHHEIARTATDMLGRGSEMLAGEKSADARTSGDERPAAASGAPPTEAGDTRPAGRGPTVALPDGT